MNAHIHSLQEPSKQESPPSLSSLFVRLFFFTSSLQGLHRVHNLLHVLILDQMHVSIFGNTYGHGAMLTYYQRTSGKGAQYEI